MNFKLDENLHPENGELLRERGHDVATVHDQGLRGHEDQEIAEVCRQEGRILLSFDLDFSNIQMFPPRAPRGPHRPQAAIQGAESSPQGS